MWTRERLEEIKKEHGILGLRQVATPLGIKGSSLDKMIDDILAKQEEVPVPENVIGILECENTEACPEIETLAPALEKFGQRWNFTFAFVPKFNAFRCIREGKEVDWVSINELIRAYQLDMQPVVGHVRQYQPPNERAYR